MKELIVELARYVAPSGAESDFQQHLLDYVRDVADEAYVDTLGNGIARKHGSGPHVMLAAHADEAGIMVIHIDDNGFLRIIPVGNLQPYTLVGRHIQFTNGIKGIVGTEAKVKLQDISFDHLYVDIGAASHEAAKSRISIGTEGVVIEPVIEIDDNRLSGRALDNRVGCAIAIEAFKQAAANGHNVTLVFTAQQAVGARGAKTAAFRLQPDLALIVDASPAGDMPDASRMELKLGAGPAVKIMDGTAIVPLSVKDELIAAAQRVGIDIQYEVWPKGLSDAGSIQLSVDGIAIGGISYPARYVGSPATVVDLRDVDGAKRWIVEVINQQSK
jgi:putative aminopeptidase FrvX